MDKAYVWFKAGLVCFIMVALLGVATLARAADAVVDSIDGDVITLDNGDTVQMTDMDGISVGDEVTIDNEINGHDVSEDTADRAESDGVDVDKVYTVESTGAEGEEY